MTTADLVELVLERRFAAPRQHLYAAFTDPDLLTRWFGPVGYSVPRASVDLDVRPGGHQRFELVPDDPRLPVAGRIDAVYDEVVENELLAGHEELTAEMAALFGAPRMTLRLEFTDDHGATRLALRQGPYSTELAPNARAGWESSFTKLDALLAE